MKPKLIQPIPTLFALLIIMTSGWLSAGEPIGTAFSYRGSLSVGGMPAAGTYDLRFTLFNSLTDGNIVGVTITNTAVDMGNGVFNAALDFGAGAFSGGRRWLEIAVRTNASPVDFETLNPRQELAPQPYALFAPIAGSAAVAQSLAAGALSGPFSLTNPANTFTGDGSELTGVNATTVNGLGSSDFWQLGGNAGTSPGSNFLGTTDDQVLELRVHGIRGLRIEPTPNEYGNTNLVNLVGGAPVNYINSAAYGSVIVGGGALNYFYEGGPLTNSVFDDLCFLGGGGNNAIGRGCYNSFLGGGIGNSIQWDGPNSFLGGGYNNTNWANGSFLGGGGDNFIESGELSFLGGGYNNTIWADGGFLGGGYNNTNWADASFLGGGSDNFIESGELSFLGGGQSNHVTGLYSVISGGFGNVASTQYAAIPGGAQANARSFGQMAYASGGFSSPGDAQSSLYICRVTTTDETLSELFLDGVSERMVVPTNSTWSFEILITARASNGDSAGFRFVGAIKNNNGVLSLLGTPQKSSLGQDISFWDAALVADSPNQDLSLRVTGQSGTLIRWVANVRTTEVMY